MMKKKYVKKFSQMEILSKYLPTSDRKDVFRQANNVCMYEIILKVVLYPSQRSKLALNELFPFQSFTKPSLLFL